MHEKEVCIPAIEIVPRVKIGGYYWGNYIFQVIVENKCIFANEKNHKAVLAFGDKRGNLFTEMPLPWYGCLS